jgi:hypothetical protein
MRTVLAAKNIESLLSVILQNTFYRKTGGVTRETFLPSFKRVAIQVICDRIIPILN